MKHLYKAYGCEKIGDETLLLPGYPIEATSRPVKAGSKIQVELADGTPLQTVVVNTKPFNFSESVMTQLRMRAKPGLYYAIQVPDDFSPTSVELGVDVFLVE